jgi:hypothetical protein
MMATLVLNGTALAAGTTIYDTIPHPTAGNYPSQPYQAQQVAEFGDQVQFAAGPRGLREITVLMSSWGCQSGAWYSNNCVSASGATFSHPVTVNVYAVGVGGAVGALLATKTQTFAIPYRPSASPSCTGLDAGKWSDGTTCYNGFATPITWDLSSLNVTLPNNVIISVAFNTSNYGAAPIGPAPCSATTAGCPYDSLNVALVNPATSTSAGTNPAPTDAYINSQTGAVYCDGGLGGVGVFRLDAGCWTGFKPAITVTASGGAPESANDCKKGGWESLSRADGSSFKNQGDCIQYFNTGK